MCLRLKLNGGRSVLAVVVQAGVDWSARTERKSVFFGGGGEAELFCVVLK
jgi:hypothetical protein